jgi:uncharacterized membrane-anchored protein
MSRLRLGLFAIVCAAQLGIPLAMAYRYERALRDGTVYRFRTEPVDPVDAFRGRYVAIRLRLVAPGEPASRMDWGDEVYATLGNDDAGFAVVRTLSTGKPSGGDWIEGTLAEPVHAEPAPGVEPTGPPALLGTRIELPLDRYYMEESKAPAADRIWAEGQRQAETVARVRVRHGVAAIEGLDVNGVPIERWIATLPPPE